MKLSSTVIAFLQNENKYLLMKRAENRTHYPGLWCGIGGGMKEYEAENPYKACLREIEEETGITSSDINSLDLMYVLICKNKGFMRITYIFFGKTSKNDIIQSEEGELFWISEKDLLHRKYSKHIAVMLEHYVKRDACDGSVYAGILSNDEIKWMPFEDCEL